MLLEYEEESNLFVLLDNSKVVGTVRFRVNEQGVQLERLAVDTD